jgi:hypothetical protein
MADPVHPLEPSTVAVSQDPNSLTNLLKKSKEQSKQAKSDTVYDTKGSSYEGFEDAEPQANPKEVAAGFAVTAAILATIYVLLGFFKKTK